MKISSLKLLTGICLVLMTACVAQAARYEIQVGNESELVFQSKAPMEKFDGKTRQLSGFFEADLSNLSGPVTLEVEVDLASFDTGKKKRNKHMRENHLETEKFPKAWFRAGAIVSCDQMALEKGKPANLVLRGTLDLHGVKKEYEVPLQLSLKADDKVLISGEFPVLITDHDIERPKFLVVKLADKQNIVINLLAAPASRR